MDITRLYLNAGLAGGNSAPIGSTNADFGANYVRSINVPSVDSDLTNKLYVDSEIATNKSYVDSEILTISLTPGDKGDKGDKGDTGENGLIGQTGIQGVTGEQGLIGEKGDTGEIGPEGPVGSQGVEGVAGIQGQRGLQGWQGDTGQIGLQGVRGEQGLIGVPGIGIVGPEGPVGSQGVEGVAGIQGQRGLQGEKGETGSYDQQMNTTDNVLFASLQTPIIKNGGSISVPNTTDTFVCRATNDTLTNKTIDSASNSVTLNTSTLTSGILPVLRGGSGVSSSTGTSNNVLSNNPVLVLPSLAQILNTGTITLPTATSTLVGRATTDTLTNKTISNAVVTNNINFNPVSNILLAGVPGANTSVLSMAGGVMKWIAPSYGQLVSGATYTTPTLIAGAAESMINTSLFSGLTLVPINTANIVPIANALGFTVLEAGLYEINGNINQLPDTDNAEIHFGICVNGSPTIFQSVCTRMSNRFSNQTVSGLFQMTAGSTCNMCYSIENVDVILIVKFMNMTIKKIV